MNVDQYNYVRYRTLCMEYSDISELIIKPCHHVVWQLGNLVNKEYGKVHKSKNLCQDFLYSSTHDSEQESLRAPRYAAKCTCHTRWRCQLYCV